jgi:hypothetical protein
MSLAQNGHSKQRRKYMQKITERKETEFKSVWANGEDVIGPIQSVAVPTGDAPYWTITLKSGDTLLVSGQVIVKRGPKVDISIENI